MIQNSVAIFLLSTLFWSIYNSALALFFVSFYRKKNIFCGLFLLSLAFNKFCLPETPEKKRINRFLQTSSTIWQWLWEEMFRSIILLITKIYWIMAIYYYSFSLLAFLLSVVGVTCAVYVKWLKLQNFFCNFFRS